MPSHRYTVHSVHSVHSVHLVFSIITKYFYAMLLSLHKNVVFSLSVLNHNVYVKAFYLLNSRVYFSVEYILPVMWNIVYCSHFYIILFYFSILFLNNEYSIFIIWKVLDWQLFWIQILSMLFMPLSACIKSDLFFKNKIIHSIRCSEMLLCLSPKKY